MEITNMVVVYKLGVGEMGYKDYIASCIRDEEEECTWNVKIKSKTGRKPTLKEMSGIIKQLLDSEVLNAKILVIEILNQNVYINNEPEFNIEEKLLNINIPL